jgi:hypothetical protein
MLASRKKIGLSLAQQEQEMKAISNTFFYFYYFFKTQAGL